ncbi:MAG: hypothetical protein JXD19_01275 [Deltaproteobacteria bacterium]|nr:hypothetical protein [Deltaproteobacteria bacterium]
MKYYSATDHTTPVKTVDFGFGKVGNLESCDDGTTTGSYDYDVNYRKILEAVNYGTFELLYSYDYYTLP